MEGAGLISGFWTAAGDSLLGFTDERLSSIPLYYRQLIDQLKISTSTLGPLEIDPRTIGAPQSVMTSLFEPLAQGRQVLFKKKEDFAKIRIKL